MIITAPFYVSFIIFTPLFCVSFLPPFVTLFPSTFHTTRSAGLFLSSLCSHAFHCFILWFLPRSDAGGLLSAVTVSEVTYLFTLLTYLFFLRRFPCSSPILSDFSYFFAVLSWTFRPLLSAVTDNHCRRPVTYAFDRLCLTLNLLTTTIVAPPSNTSKWQMGFNSAFKGLRQQTGSTILVVPELAPDMALTSHFGQP